jgi:transposase
MAAGGFWTNGSRRQCGQWRPEKFERIHDLAGHSIGLKDP